MKQVDLNAINTPQTHQTQRGDCTRPNGTTNVGTTKSGPKPQSDQVEVSTVGMEIGQLVERAKSLPDVRTERVEALRELLQSGRYEVSSRTIAEAILRDEF